MALWEKGKSGNPAGRPKKGKTHLEALEKAVAEHEKKTGQNLWEHFVKRAFEDDRVMISLGRKLIADKSTQEIEGVLSGGIKIKWEE